MNTSFRIAFALIWLGSAAAVSAWMTRQASAGGSSSMKINWRADRRAAEAEARRTGKALMVWSVGPSTRSTAPWDHPIVVDAADEFVPLREPSADDASTVQFFSAGGASIGESFEPSASAQVLKRMRLALEAAGRPAPAYLRLVADEYNPAAREVATFTVGCYWKGEQAFGAAPGVVATRTGWLKGEEVVEVEFDPTAVAYGTLLKRASGVHCFRSAIARSDAQRESAKDVTATRTDEPIRPADDPKFNLSLEPAYYFLPLTDLQASRCNTNLAEGESPDRWLSPSQSRMKSRLDRLLSNDNLALQHAKIALVPDRTPTGLADYASRVERFIEAND